MADEIWGSHGGGFWRRVDSAFRRNILFPSVRLKWDDMFLRNAGVDVRVYTASQPRKTTSSPTWHLHHCQWARQISHSLTVVTPSLCNYLETSDLWMQIYKFSKTGGSVSLAYSIGCEKNTGLFKMIHIFEVYKYRVISDTSTKRTTVEVLSLTL
jgi:hypothetical protein